MKIKSIGNALIWGAAFNLKIAVIITYLFTTIFTRAEGADLKTRDGRIFYNYSIIRGNRYTITISHSGGTADIPHADFPEEIAQLYSPNLKTKDGRIYRNYSIQEISFSDFTIWSTSGRDKISHSDMPDCILRKYKKIIDKRKKEHAEYLRKAQKYQEEEQAKELAERKRKEMIKTLFKICRSKTASPKDIKGLIDAGVDVNVKDKKGNTPLHIAADKGKTEVASVLIQAHADVNIKNKEGISPLYIAILKEQIAIVKLLIQAKADVNMKNSNGFTPLHEATNSGNFEIVKELIRAGVDVNMKCIDKTTALYIASREGRIEIVKELIQAGADVNAKAEDGLTPMLIATMKGQTEIVKELIRAKADVNVKAKNDITSLHAAVALNKTEIAKALICAGADVNAKVNNNRTPLHVASEKGEIEIVNALIKAGADVNMKCIDKTTALYIASREGRTEIVKELIQAGADVNAKAEGGLTPMHIATMKGQIEIVKELIRAKADVNVKDENDFTSLNVAVALNKTEIAKALIYAGADVNAKVINEQTPLHVASAKGEIEIVRALIKAGADVNALNRFQKTPFQVAKNYKVKELLRNARAESDGFKARLKYSPRKGNHLSKNKQSYIHNNFNSKSPNNALVTEQLRRTKYGKYNYSLTPIVITSVNATRYSINPKYIVAFDKKIQEIRSRIKNYKSFEELEQEAQKGNVSAQYRLGAEYQYFGWKKFNSDKANYWFTKAAQQGNAGAAFALYFTFGYEKKEYLNTIFESVNTKNPFAEQPSAGYYAGRALEILNSRGMTLPANWKKSQDNCYLVSRVALFFYATAGDIEAQEILAYMWAKGYGGKKDINEAQKWYNIAAQGGSMGALEKLEYYDAMKKLSPNVDPDR